MPTNSLEDAIHQNGFHIIDDFLDLGLFHHLYQQIQNTHLSGAFQTAKIGRSRHTQHNPQIRSDNIFWLDQNDSNPSLRAFFSAIDDIKRRLNQSLYLGLDHFEAHFAVYQPGDYYKKHIDQFKTTQHRLISWVYYFNENWQPEHGGELVLYPQEDFPPEKVAPKANRLICFRSDLPHEVLITHQRRYSLTGWIKKRSLQPLENVL